MNILSSASGAPRFIRLRDAPAYLGMDKNRFNRNVRPLLCVIPFGTQGIAFDRVDLDAWADEYKNRNGRPAASLMRSKPSETKERQASRNVVAYGTSTSSFEEHAFARALERATFSKRRSPRQARDGTTRGETVRCAAGAHVSGSGNQVPGGESAQAKSRTRRSGPRN